MLSYRCQRWLRGREGFIEAMRELEREREKGGVGGTRVKTTKIKLDGTKRRSEKCNSRGDRVLAIGGRSFTRISFQLVFDGTSRSKCQRSIEGKRVLRVAFALFLSIRNRRAMRISVNGLPGLEMTGLGGNRCSSASKLSRF